MTKKGTGTSTRPRQVRTRLRRGSQDVAAALPLLGYPPIDQWTFAELAAGRPKGFSGSMGAWMKPAAQEEIVRRLKLGLYGELRTMMPEVVKVLKKLLRDDDNPNLQMQAVKLLLEYVIGAPERRVAVREATVGEMLLADIITLDDGEEMYQGRMIEGEVVEDEEDDDLPTK